MPIRTEYDPTSILRERRQVLQREVCQLSEKIARLGLPSDPATSPRVVASWSSQLDLIETAVQALTHALRFYR